VIRDVFATARWSRMYRSGRGGPIRWLGRFGVRHIVVMARVVVMAHRTRLLMAAFYADEYLVVQIKGRIG
jgi:hypothetical protein